MKTEPGRACIDCGASLTRKSTRAKWPKLCPFCRRARSRAAADAHAAKEGGELKRRYMRDRHSRVKSRVNGDRLSRSRRRREQCIKAYGGRCACCGEDRYEFLAIDHVRGGGQRHAKEHKGRLAAWLIRNGFPEGFRLLCHNCNCSLGFYGYCPHGPLRQEQPPTPQQDLEFSA